MVRSSQKRFLSFPVMGAMLGMAYGVLDGGEGVGDGEEGEVGMKEWARRRREDGGRGQTRVHREACRGLESVTRLRRLELLHAPIHHLVSTRPHRSHTRPVPPRPR